MSQQQLKHEHRQIPGGNLRESFSWTPDEYIRFLVQTEAGSIYRVRAIHVTKTLNRVEFTEDELRLAARSLGYRPIDLNHEPPYLEFPQNRVIDAEFEDARVEALIAIRDTGIMSMVEARKITAVSIEAQYRWADVVCDPEECWLRPVGIIFTGLALLTPGVEPGDPLASIVMKKLANAPTALGTSAGPVTVSASAGSNASSVIGTTAMVDTISKTGGVLMEKKEATPPLETPQEAKPTGQTPPLPQQPAVPAGCAKEEECTPAKVHQAIKDLSTQVVKIGEQVGSLESHVKLLAQQRRGTRRT